MAPESIVVNITPGDLAFGKRRSPNFSPISIAIEREYGWKAVAGNTWVTVYFPGDCCMPKSCWAYEISVQGVRFIVEHDNGDPVRPQMFSIYKDRPIGTGD